jgi:hypothetical protein
MKSIIFAASLAAILTASVMAPAMATSFESWQQVASSSVATHDSKSKLSVTASGDIPQHTAALAGFAWFYKDIPNLVFVGVTHKGVVDSVQNPNGWHTHNVVLGGVPSGDTTSNFCIVQVTKYTFANLDIKGNTMTITVDNSELPDALTGSAVGFSIVPDTGCSSGLGVAVDVPSPPA